MRLLKIKTPGLYINLPGISARRTPATIDITKLDINSILIELRKFGVNDFVIENSNQVKNNKIKSSERITRNIKKEENVELNNKESIKFLTDPELKDKINNIERMLEELLNNKDSLITNNKIIKSENNKSDDEEEDEDFIPEINLNGLKLNK